MHRTESCNPLGSCLKWADAENHTTSENTRKIINTSLVLIQLVGLLLLVASVPGSTQLVAMPETITLSLALTGGVVLLGGSFFWALLGYSQKHPAVKKAIYVLTAIAVLTIAIGIIGYNGLFSGMTISAARCTMAAGFILALPVIFPYLFSLLRCCHSRLESSQAEQKKAALDLLLSRKQQTSDNVGQVLARKIEALD